MPIDAKEALGYLGVDPEAMESMDVFKETIDSTFQKREEAKQFHGRLISSSRSAISKLAKELELEDAIDKDALNKTDKPWELTRVVVDKLRERYDANINSLNEQIKVGGTTVPEEVAKKLEAREKRVKDLESALNATQAEFEGFKLDITKKEQSRVLDGYRAEAEKSLKFDASVDDLRKEGFLSRVRAKYRVDLDEEGKPAVFDEGGERVKDPKKHGAYKDLASLLSEEAEKLNLTPKNPMAGKTIPGVKPPAAPPQFGVPPVRTKRAINPAALG
jgi:hypothetical protein